MKKKKHSVFKSTEGQALLKSRYESILESWPVPMEKIFIPTRLGETFCVKSGEISNPPMVLIHGSGSNSATWMADIEKFSENYQVFCIDIPGEPGGSEDSRFSWKDSSFSDWLLECLDYLEIKQVVAGGLSLGGWVVLRFTIDHPERVKKLFLLAPGGIVPAKKGFVFKMIGLSILGKWGQERIIEMLFHGKDVTQEFREFFYLTNKHFKYRMGNPPFFTDEELASVNVPVIFIGGKEDALIDTQKTSDRLARYIPDCRNLVIDEGHALIRLGGIVCEQIQ